MSSKSNLVLDIAVAAAFLTLCSPRLTGLPVHEWLGISFGVVTIVHLLFHWNWIAHVTRRLLPAPPRGARLNYLVDAWLFISFTAVILSGVLISKSFLPFLGLAASPIRAWREIHEIAADACMVGLGVHLGLHWRWIVHHIPRLLGRSATTTFATATAGQPAAGVTE
jgi:hypothetical protein